MACSSEDCADKAEQFLENAGTNDIMALKGIGWALLAIARKREPTERRR